MSDMQQSCSNSSRNWLCNEVAWATVKVAWATVNILSPNSICDDADCKLFARITGNGQHLQYLLLPPERKHQYTLQQCSHNFQLPDRTSILKDKNFIMRMLYSDSLYW